MPSGQLKAGKKRYTIALEQKPYDDLKAALKRIGAPMGTSASMLDDYIKSLVVLFAHMEDMHKEGRKMTLIEAMAALSKMLKAAQVNEEL